MLNLAAQAHRERRDFLETLGASQGSPLGMIAWAEGGAPYADPANALAPVAVEGLYECVRYLCNARLGESDDARALAMNILQQLGDRCAVIGEREGVRLALVANEDARASTRLATIDGGEFPKSLASVFEPSDDAAALSYATGVSVPASAEIRPFERARLDGAWSECLHAHAPTALSIPRGGMSADSLADFLRKLYRDETCRGVRFM